ncbi:MAG: 2-hydroxyacyl-CoA dehydratase [candidate division WOR-3 bacterium]|nr:MAG: 2-hydroxyacyl-CoA dehydratase [candidate division WOR-3 bacterium]
MNLIGYTCPYVPVELLSAAGFQPYCLLHGNYELMQKGTEYARIDACPMVRANIAYVLDHTERFAALVGTTGCDMSRRMFDVISEYADVPIFIVNVPRTDNPVMYSDEIDRLIKELSYLSGKDILTNITHEIIKWKTARIVLRGFDEKRAAAVSLVSTSDFHGPARSFYKGDINRVLTSRVAENESQRPHVFMIGSELSYESTNFLDLIEEDVRIVGDDVCGLSRSLHVNIKENTIDGIKRAYYEQPPCIYRRPNHEFHKFISAQLKERTCDGVIGFTLDYCDAYEFEMRTMEKVSGLPLLRIRTDYAAEKISQLRTRIAAFGEMLCSKT